MIFNIHSADLLKAIKFIAELSKMYSEKSKLEGSFLYVKAKEDTATLVFSEKSMRVVVKIPCACEDEGAFVINPYYLEALPKKAADTRIQAIKKEDGFHLFAKNGKSTVDLVFENDTESFLKQMLSKNEVPEDNCISVDFSKLNTAVSSVYFKSTDERYDVTTIPIKIVSNENKSYVYSADGYCAAVCAMKMENSKNITVLTSINLLRALMKYTEFSMLRIYSSSFFTRFVCPAFDVTVPTGNLYIDDVVSWLQNCGKADSVASVVSEDLCSIVEDACVVSKLDSIKPVVSLSFKNSRAYVYSKSSVGRSKSFVEAEHSKETTVRFNADWFLTFASKIKGKMFMHFYPTFSYITNEDKTMTCVISVMD